MQAILHLYKVMHETPELDIKENQSKSFRKDLLCGQCHGQRLLDETHDINLSINL